MNRASTNPSPNPVAAAELDAVRQWIRHERDPDQFAVMLANREFADPEAVTLEVARTATLWSMALIVHLARFAPATDAMFARSDVAPQIRTSALLAAQRIRELTASEPTSVTRWENRRLFALFKFLDTVLQRPELRHDVEVLRAIAETQCFRIVHLEQTSAGPAYDLEQLRVIATADVSPDQLAYGLLSDPPPVNSDVARDLILEHAASASPALVLALQQHTVDCGRLFARPQVRELVRDAIEEIAAHLPPDDVDENAAETTSSAAPRPLVAESSTDEQRAASLGGVPAWTSVFPPSSLVQCVIAAVDAEVLPREHAAARARQRHSTGTSDAGGETTLLPPVQRLLRSASASASLASAHDDPEAMVRSPRIWPESAMRIAERELLAGRGVNDRFLFRFPSAPVRDALRLAFGAGQASHRDVLEVAERWRSMQALLERLAPDPNLVVLIRVRWLLVDWDGGMYAIEQQRDDHAAVAEWRRALAVVVGEADEVLRKRFEVLADANPSVLP
jgi:hypothetical protein